MSHLCIYSGHTGWDAVLDDVESINGFNLEKNMIGLNFHRRRIGFIKEISEETTLLFWMDIVLGKGKLKVIIEAIKQKEKIIVKGEISKTVEADSKKRNYRETSKSTCLPLDL